MFARGFSAEAKGTIEIIQADAAESELAIGLLNNQIEQKYGHLTQIRWWPAPAMAVEIGQRVWVAQGNDRKAEGVIASVNDGFLGGSGFVVQLDGENKVVTCAEDRRGTQWDFASD